MSRETERPLGQDSRPKRPPRRRISALGVAAGVAGAALIAISVAISLGQSPFRDPPRTVVSEPKVEDAAEATAEAPRPTMPDAPMEAATTGPKIIHVNQDPGSGQAGIVVRDPASFDRNLRFAHLPDRALIEESETGPLPVRGPDGRRPFDVYARPWSGKRGAMIAVVIGGLGLSQTGTQSAIAKLPPEVTLAFAPQGNSLDRWMREARQTGHEIIMQVPLEPYDYPNVNPGRNTLTVAASPNQNLRELRWALSRITNYTGVMNYMGARFTADRESVQLLMEEISERGLGYLDDGTSARSLAEEVALKNGVPFALADEVIDQTRERGAILEQLAGLERIARAKGMAIGTGSAFEVTVDAVQNWATDVVKRGIEIVPISAVTDDPERSQAAADGK